MSNAPHPKDRPAWAGRFSVATRPVKLCSPLSPETLVTVAPSPSQPLPATLAAGACQPLLGADNAVPWPMPIPPDVSALTFWGVGDATTVGFSIAGGGSVRILNRSGAFQLLVQKDDGTYLNDVAELDDGELGVLAIPRSGTYVLSIKAQAEWGVTVLHLPALFQPHMPLVRVLADTDAFFANVWSDLAFGYPEAIESLDDRCVAIVTPEREVIVQTFQRQALPPSAIISAEQLLPPSPKLIIAVVSYTLLEALKQDVSKCIPYFGYLGAFAAIGHRVLVFEGHPSAFASAVRHCDVLLVDSGMVPFLQSDWVEVARGAMHPAARVLLHDRETYKLSVVT